MGNGRLAYSLAIVAVLVSSTTVCAGRSSISLDVSRSFDPTGQPGGLVINCSIDTTTAGVQRLAGLTVFGSRPYGPENDLDQLANLDIWSKSPKLAEDLEEADVSVDGDLRSDPMTTPHLVLAWRSRTASTRHVYRCVANGIDSDGQAVSVSTTVQVGALDPGCCHKMDKIRADLSGLSDRVEGTLNVTEQVASQILSLDTRFGDVETTCATLDGKVTAQFQSLANGFEKLEDKFGDVDGRDTSRMATLTTKVEELTERLGALEQNMNRQFRMLGIDKGRFDVSSVYQDRVYLVSKTKEAFDIARANNLCRESGGYLVELDDTPEYQFVFTLVSTTGGTNSFWTGGNDIDNEGTFVYYSSKKPVPVGLWLRGQPNNGGGIEDCMEIRIDYGGINDWVCHELGKFVCEVPI